MSAWRVAAADDREALEAFLYPQEWTCVTFTALLLARAYDVIHVHRVGTSATEAVMLGQHGLVLPVLDPREPTFPAELGRRLPSALTVMGTDESVIATERSLGRAPTRAVSYHLMKMPLVDWRDQAQAPPSPKPPRVRQALLSDLPGLYPLQRDYEKEEVLLDPSLHDPRLCRTHLKRTLREQVVYLAEINGSPVSKAGTNARGRGYDQIGGVFTITGFRGHGLARAVMIELLRRIYTEKDGVCLFVKRENTPAVTLYRHLGFQHTGGFRISYYLG